MPLPCAGKPPAPWIKEEQDKAKAKAEAILLTVPDADAAAKLKAEGASHVRNGKKALASGGLLVIPEKARQRILHPGSSAATPVSPSSGGAAEKVVMNPLMKAAAAARPAAEKPAAELSIDAEEALYANMRYPLGAKTGAFCSKRGENCLFCICRGLRSAAGRVRKSPVTTPKVTDEAEDEKRAWRVSELVEMGSGVTGHFKLLKYFVGLYFSLFILYLPLIGYNTNAGGPEPPPMTGLATTTAGHISPFNGTLIETSSGFTIALDLATMYGGLDVFGIIIFLIGYMYVRVFADREQESVDKYTVTVQDYALMIPNIPHNTTKADVRAWVKETVKSVAESRVDPNYLAQTINADYKAGDGKVPDLINISGKSREQLLDEVFAVADITIVHDHSQFLKFARQMGAMKRKLALIEGALKARALAKFELKGKCCGEFKSNLAGGPFFGRLCGKDLGVSAYMSTTVALMNASDALDALMARVAVLDAARAAGKQLAPEGLFKCIKKPAVPADPMPPVTAFLIFEHSLARDTYLEMFPDDDISLMLQPLICPRRRLVTGGTQPAPKRGSAPAPPPGGFKPVAHRTRVLGAPNPDSVLWHNLRLGRGARRIRNWCSLSVGSFIIAISFGIIFLCSVQQQAYQAQLKPTDCSGKIFTAFVRSYKRSKKADKDINLARSFPPSNKLLYCVCDSKRFSTFTSEAALLNQTLITENACPYQACPILDSLGSTWQDGNEECDRLRKIKSEAANFSIAASIVVAIINQVIGAVIRFLSDFEGHHSTETQEIAVSLRLFMGLFFNTAILVVIVNAAWGSIGRYPDLTAGWYATVGTSLLTTMLLQAITPHIGVIVNVVLAVRKWRNKEIWRGNVSQAAVKVALLGPPMDFARRTAMIFNVVFTTYAFASGLPLMTFAGFIGAISSYWVDKLALLRLHRRPPFTANNLLLAMVTLLPIAALIHSGVSAWVYGSISQLEDTSVDYTRPTTPTPGKRMLAQLDAGLQDTESALVDTIGAPAYHWTVNFARTATVAAFAALAKVTTRQTPESIAAERVLQRSEELQQADVDAFVTTNAPVEQHYAPFLTELVKSSPQEGMMIHERREAQQVARREAERAVEAQRLLQAYMGGGSLTPSSNGTNTNSTNGTVSMYGYSCSSSCGTAIQRATPASLTYLTYTACYIDTSVAPASGSLADNDVQMYLGGMYSQYALESSVQYPSGMSYLRLPQLEEQTDGTVRYWDYCLPSGNYATDIFEIYSAGLYYPYGYSANDCSCNGPCSERYVSNEYAYVCTVDSWSCNTASYDSYLGSVDSCGIPVPATAKNYSLNGCVCKEACQAYPDARPVPSSGGGAVWYGSGTPPTSAQTVCVVDGGSCWDGVYWGYQYNETASLSGDWMKAYSSYYYDDCSIGGGFVRSDPCVLNWYLPECSVNASSGGGGELASLISGVNISGLDFLRDPELLRALKQGGGGSSSSGGMASDGASTLLDGIDIDRAIQGSAAAPLFALFIVAGALLVLSNVIFTLVSFTKTVAKFACPGCSKKEKIDPAGEEGDKTIPFTNAAYLGEAAMFNHRELNLVGRSYNIECQDNLLYDTGLDEVLLSVDPSIKASHLLFASEENDGVFGDPRIRGLAFLSTLWWAPPERIEQMKERQRQVGKTVELPENWKPTNYRERLREWFEASSEVGPMDARLLDPRPWEQFSNVYAATVAERYGAN